MNELTPVQLTDFTRWVRSWERCYESAEDDKTYDVAVKVLGAISDQQDFEAARPTIISVFEWKNGSRLSKAKGNKVALIDYDLWRTFKTATQPQSYFSGAIWNIFLWHLATNGKKPIFDQHCWRAYCDILGKDCDELEEAQVSETFNYYKEYELWFNKRANTAIEPRSLDRALMAYGQFLKSQFKPLLKQL